MGIGKKGGDPISPQQCSARLHAIGDALYAIGGKWKLRIIVALSSGNKRFNELQRQIDGISSKVLSAELKELELNGFVSRNIFTGTPVTVEYQLSDYSHSLEGVLNALSEWGAQHRNKIKQELTTTRRN